jgi:hypothetical protein
MDPDRTAVQLLERLQEEKPGEFCDGHLRTLQRRVKAWRSARAREFVFGNAELQRAATLTSDLLRPRRLVRFRAKLAVPFSSEATGGPGILIVADQPCTDREEPAETGVEGRHTAGDGFARIGSRYPLPYEEILERLRALTNLRVVPDEASDTGYRVDAGPFPGWKTVPVW